MKRGAFIASSATVVAASGASGLAQSSPPGGTHFVERKSDFDRPAFEAIVGRSADVRQLFETIAFKPAAFNNVKNSLNGFQFGYGYDPRSIAIAVAGHGPSSAFTYTDYVWKKYRIGEFLSIKDPSGATQTTNVYYAAKAPYDVNADPDDEKGMYQDTSVEMLQRRGVIMLTCHTAVEEQAKGLVKGGFAPSDMPASAVASDILTHLIPGAVVNPSMVATVGFLQAKFHYTYVALTF